MAVLGLTQLTLLDWAKRTTPDGSVETMIAEMLSQDNEILHDVVYREGNLPTGHLVVQRVSLPVVSERALNAGAQLSSSGTAQVTETCSMIEGYSRIDVDVARLNGDSAAFRLSEDSAFIEAMNQTQARALFYGNPANDPRQYMGLTPRYNALNAGNAQNILDGGGTASNNTSIWIVAWGEQTVFCPFPKGSKAGLQVYDDGLMTVQDANGNPYKVFQSHFKWDSGLALKDWRSVCRISNVNVANLVSETGAADIVKLISRGLDRIKIKGGRLAIYMNPTVYSALRIQALNKSSNALAIEKALTQFGNHESWLTFFGIPIRKVEALLNTEARVV